MQWCCSVTHNYPYRAAVDHLTKPLCDGDTEFMQCNSLYVEPPYMPFIFCVQV